MRFGNRFLYNSALQINYNTDPRGYPITTAFVNTKVLRLK